MNRSVSMCCLFFGVAQLLAAVLPDAVFFDEDDPLGRDYYDAAIGRFSGGSFLQLKATSRDKMPMTQEVSYKGKSAGVLEWRSEPGGDWSLLLFNLGFAAKDISGHELLILHLNAPKAIPGSQLPRLALESGENQFSSYVHPEKFLPHGLDGDLKTWQRLEIPLREFTGANLKRVRALQFRQSTPGQHTLFLDDLRFGGGEPETQLPLPPAPKSLVAQAGDQAVNLCWQAVQAPGVRGYHVYRAETRDGSFQRITDEPVSITSFADIEVANGKSYYYKVAAINDWEKGPFSEAVRADPQAFESDQQFLDFLQRVTFNYFWYEADPATGMIRDRSQPWSAASIAGMGFGLSAICIAVEREWISREEGRERVLNTLRTLFHAPQGPDPAGTSGFKGWFYHFLEVDTGLRFGNSELSSIDTALLLAGVLDCEMFFDKKKEKEIRRLARQLFERVDWAWMLNGGNTLSMGWYPNRGFIEARWKGYNEASLLYLLGLGASEGKALGPQHWKAWTSTYQWATHFGYSFIQFPPLFGHQYSACWIDFRGISDEYTREKGITYFENSRRATLAQRAYCRENPLHHPGYSEKLWGITACDGPGSDGFLGYHERGAPPPRHDDGTIAPTASGGSLPFTPEESLSALRHMYRTYRRQIWSGYGFRDAFNLKADWWATDTLAIDQGAILLMAENLRTGQTWNRVGKHPVIQRGLRRAGFR